MDPQGTVVRAWKPNGIAELRVHGIGDHKEWSSLGSPTLYVDGGDDFPTLVAPPTQPPHDVALFNWSRVTRRVLRVLWYVAFPFTLLNVAYQMSPSVRGWRRVVHATLIHIASLGLTVLTLLWLLRLLERIPATLGHTRLLGLDASVVAMWIGVVVAIGWLLARARHGAVHRLFAFVHGAAIVAVTGIVHVLRPAQIPIDPEGLLIGNASYAPSPESYGALYEYFRSRPDINDTFTVEMRPYLDVVSLATWIGLAAAMVIVLLLLGVAATQKKDANTAPLIGAATCVALSYLIVILTLSALVGRIPGLIRQATGSLPLLQGAYADIPVLYLNSPYGTSRSGATIPGFVLSLLLVALVTGLVWARFRPLRFVIVPLVKSVGAKWPRKPDRAAELDKIRNAELNEIRKEQGEWSHGAVCDRLPDIMVAAVMAIVFVAEAGAYFLGTALTDGAEIDHRNRFLEYAGGTLVSPTPPVSSIEWGLAGLSAVAVASAFWMLSAGASGPLRQILAKIGDVSGFWPVTVSPFGGKPYREVVVNALKAVIETGPGPERVVLVGHSQGSVLAAWYSYGLGKSEKGRRLHALVTCGSPLVSLYARFFPDHFSPEFFATVVPEPRVWANVWRGTDPISTEIPEASQDVPLGDPPAGDARPRGHHDYWIDTTQRQIVEHLCLGSGLRPTVGQDEEEAMPAG